MTEGEKRNIEIQLLEYEEAIAAAVKWYAEWKSRQPKGFKALRAK